MQDLTNLFERNPNVNFQTLTKILKQGLKKVFWKPTTNIKRKEKSSMKV